MGGGALEEQCRRTREQIVAEEVLSTVDEEVFVAVRQHGCAQRSGCGLASESAGNSKGGRAYSSSGMLWFFLLNSLMSSFPVVETRKSQWNVSGVQCRETGLFLLEETTSLSEVFDPVWCAHLRGN